ncbi:glycosyltransferase [Paenibacillus rhizophilus]|uniref:Glycosyltransferase family 4 protein n=1 Tax=Paenibacillus rhizophilus TaxID=1850366 RepID=A0A3N9P3K9_9BACL|nr:glycosyltransferase [Paenibacillus rhizophilus]RQW09664.1 glycosyltransferase family 4 protein [Paenibacillus rhizophilus]
MIIVQVAPNIIPLPGSGGLERVVYNLSDALVDMGHEVYVYALAGSRSRAVVIPYGHRYETDSIKDFVLDTIPDNTDIIHDHTHDLLFGQEDLNIPTVATIHTEWSLHVPVKHPVYVSRTKLKQSPNRHKGYYVHNGIDLNEYKYSKHKEDYLLFLGRIDWEKGVHTAIDVAEMTGIRTIIAGPAWDGDLFNQILPRINNSPNIEYVSEVHGKEKQDLLRHAKWLMFPTACEEQFGLVMIEAMACGTPVAAFPRGAVPEVLSGFPQFLCESAEDMAKMVMGDASVHPEQLRQYVADRFTKEKMAERYLKVYEKVIGHDHYL